MKNRSNGGGSVIQKQSRKSHKKECDLGRNCPYQEEYQHMLEFSHDCAPSARNAPVRANNLGFVGSGHRLGGSAEPNWNRQAPRMWDDLIQCELCSARVSVEQIATHLAQHESIGNTKNLKSEQDNALEESMLLDIQRLSEQESTRQAELEKERKAAEMKEMEEALAISVAEAHRAERDFAAKNLLPEPDADYPDSKVVIKFILSDTNKLKRTFRASSPVQNAFQFLRAQEELEGKRFLLRNAVNTLSLEAGDARSFEQAGVLTNTSLLVVPVVAASEAALPAPVTSSSSSGSSANSSSSSSNVSVSGVVGGGDAGNARKRSRGALTASGGDEEVIDLLSPQPPRKMPAGGRGGGSGSSSSGGGGNRGAGRGLLFTPHRSSGDAVIDLTLS